ncbi:MAG: family 43 glycosylhydrolase [Limisphaerales bacterium]
MFFLTSLLNGSANEITYANPVLSGDFPDPSIVRVGEDFWATATSTEWAPLFPILHSRDLVNWELAGHIFEKKPAWSSQNYWAPEISYHEGKFYVYYVGRQNETNGSLHIACATAKNAKGPWTDHGSIIGQEEGSIDPVTALDEKSERYLIWKNDGNSRNLPTIIYAQKISEDGTKLTGKMKELLRNDAPWEGNLIEGPFVLKRGEWFYLFFSGNGCCGRDCAYGLGVARSKNLLGPYEKNPDNPILAGNEKWKCPGHGSIVHDAQGRDFLLYHAYAATDFIYVGRQGLLDEVKWEANNWPTINQKQGPSSEALSPFGKTKKIAGEFFDDFASTNLDLRWQWPHSLEPILKIEKGRLLLTSPTERGDDLIGSILAVNTTSGNYAATTFLDGREIKPGAQAGLFAIGDKQNALGLTVGQGKASVLRRQKNKTEMVATIDLPKTEKIYLRVTAKNGHLFQFAIWADDRAWKNVGGDIDVEGNYLPPWDRGVRIALTVGGMENATAKFDWLRVVPK